MPRFKLILEYDGTDFEGWQVQRDRDRSRTIQGTLEAAVARITGCSARVTGAGRTDSGVHAQGQVAHLDVEARLGAEELARALAGVLPEDVAAVEVSLAPDAFHARYDAVSKLYRYSIWNGSRPSPLRRRRSDHVRRRLDVAAMRRAAPALVGTHDFRSFQAAGSGVVETQRTISRLEITGGAGGLVEIEVEGSGFLRHMVRNLAGTLIEVGLGRRDADSLSALLGARDRRQAGPTAPARGLTLVQVRYPRP